MAEQGRWVTIKGRKVLIKASAGSTPRKDTGSLAASLDFFRRSQGKR